MLGYVVMYQKMYENIHTWFAYAWSDKGYILTDTTLLRGVTCTSQHTPCFSISASLPWNWLVLSLAYPFVVVRRRYHH